MCLVLNFEAMIFVALSLEVVHTTFDVRYHTTL